MVLDNGNIIWKKVLFSVCLVWLVVGVEVKETLCGSVDAIVHEAFDSRVKQLVGSVLMGCSGIIASAMWCATRGPVVV